MRRGRLAWPVFHLLGNAALFAAEGTEWKPSVTLQTGFARTFQLNLGGIFGNGPAWQNRVMVDLPGIIRRGDAIALFGFLTVDTPSLRRDWMTGAGYRLAPFRFGSGSLTLTGGWQRWLLPSVPGGPRDHLASINAVYRARWRWPVTIIADNWTILQSPLRKGNMTHVQGNVSHLLWEGSGVRLVARHGPSTTYSYRFWDRPGWRFIRYGGCLALESKSYTFEASLRQQAAIAPRIPHNPYWAVLLSRRL
jgi:hypothetical protein